jgi:uncharacterized protein with HEPN domain
LQKGNRVQQGLLARYLCDERTFDAIVRNLQIIGEAVKVLPDWVRDIRPEQEWAKIAGLRNLLVHHYFGLDEQVLWDAVQNDVPPLLVAGGAILDDPRLA